MRVGVFRCAYYRQSWHRIYRGLVQTDDLVLSRRGARCLCTWVLGPLPNFGSQISFGSSGNGSWRNQIIAHAVPEKCRVCPVDPTVLPGNRIPRQPRTIGKGGLLGDSFYQGLCTMTSTPRLRSSVSKSPAKNRCASSCRLNIASRWQSVSPRTNK